jgi:hypothetical protein
MDTGSKLPVLNRACGTCVTCCTVMGITELAKPRHEVCRHSFEQGCRIYAERPQTCRQFYCAWIQGEGNEEDRPDKLGVFFWRQFTPPLRENVLICEEAFPGAAKQPRAQAILDARAKIELIVIRSHGSDIVLSLVGPPDKLARAVAVLQLRRQLLDPKAAREMLGD